MFWVVSVISGGDGGATHTGVSVSCTEFTTTAGSGNVVVNSGNMLAGVASSPLPNVGCSMPKSPSAGGIAGSPAIGAEPTAGGGNSGVKSGKNVAGSGAVSLPLANCGCVIPGAGGVGSGATGGQPGGVGSAMAAPAWLRRAARRREEPGPGRSRLALKAPRQARLRPVPLPVRRDARIEHPTVGRVQLVRAGHHVMRPLRRLGDRPWEWRPGRRRSGRRAIRPSHKRPLTRLAAAGSAQPGSRIVRRRCYRQLIRLTVSSRPD